MIADLPLPSAVQIEEELLGCMLVDTNEDTLDIIQQLTPEDFFNRSNRMIFTEIKDKWANSMPFDMLSIITTLKDKGILSEVGGDFYVARLTSRYTLGFKAIFGMDILREKSRLRKILEISQDLRMAAYANENSQEIINHYEPRLSDVVEDCTQDDLKQSGVKEVYDMIETRMKGEPVYGIPTGIKSFDEIFHGLQKSQYYVVAGRPSAGKTALIDQACISFIQSHVSVVYIPLESSQSRVIGKIACKMSQISFTRFIQGKCNESELIAIKKSTEHIQSSHIIFKRPVSNTPDSLRALLKREIHKNDAKIFIIDYVQKILDENGDPRTGVMKASMIIQDVCVETGAIGLAICQMNRDAEKEKRPRMGHLKESGQIEQDADNIIMVWNEKEKHELEPNELMPSILTIEKNKDGIAGIDQKVAFDRELMTFRERLRI